MPCWVGRTSSALESSKGEELKQGLDTIERNARAQAQLIEDLLDVSRIISGKVRLRPAEVNLPSVLNESIETLRATANAKGVRLMDAVRPFAVSISSQNYLSLFFLQNIYWIL
jgi:signal transduction histidine kinase